MPDKITVEKIQTRIERAPAKQDDMNTGVENIDFKKLEIKRQAEEKIQQKAIASAGNVSINNSVNSAQISIKEIERILSEDLEDIYVTLPAGIQQKFRQKGEETAIKISKILSQSKIKLKKIAKLIMDWLKVIPGVNKFFLEKESKIKTDEVVKLKVKS